MGNNLVLHVQDGLVRHLSLVLGLNAGLVAQCDRAEEDPLARVSPQPRVKKTKQKECGSKWKLRVR